MLIYSPKILKVSQDIGFCLIIIIKYNDNNNIKFYLSDIIKTYIEITLNFNPNFISNNLLS